MRWSAPVLGVVICLVSTVAWAEGLDVTHHDLAVDVKLERLEVGAHTAKLAKRFLERPYRGYGTDG